MTFPAPRRRAIALLLLLAAPPLLAGCAILGVAANAMPKPPVKPKVILAGTSTGVMVWADRGLRAANPTVRQDLGGGIHQRLLIAQKAQQKELEGTTFPFPPESFLRWQADHPDFESEPIATVAARLSVRRLIYVEVDSVSTRSANAIALYRGSAEASVKVFNADNPETPATLIYEERIKVVWPKTSTEDGRPDSSDDKMYVGAVSSLADEIAKRFIEHPAED